MTDKVAVLFSIISVLGGATLLYDSVTDSATGQTAQILGGATLLALGLFGAFYVIQDWRRWRKENRPADHF